MTSGAEVAEYLLLLQAFTRGETSVDEFMRSYFQLFKAEKRLFEEPLFEILNGVFTALDCHVEEGLRTWDFELNTEKLIAEVKQHHLELIRYLGVE